MPAGSGDRDQIRACICDLEPIAQFNNPSRLLLSNKLEDSTKKKKINLLIQFIVLDFNLLVIGKSLTRLLLDTLLSFAHFIIRKC